MNDIFTLLGGIQNGGGIMLVLIYLAFEVRSLKRDFNKHEELYEHKPRRI